MNLGYCILISKYRLHQGWVLLNTLIHHSKDAKAFILCMDQDVYNALNKLQPGNTELTFINEIENDELHAKKSERILNEYCWTLKPIFIEHILKKHGELDYVTYLDADLCFFSDPSVIYRNQPESSVLITPHNFTDGESGAAKTCGKFNSGFVGFKRDAVSQACLSWWKEKCLEWCFDSVGVDKFGDQKYLDHFPRMFREAQAVRTPGANIAPWNQAKYHFSLQNGQVYINSDRLIFYHFCGFRLLNRDEFALVLGSELSDIVYKPYVMCIDRCLSDFEKAGIKNNYFCLEDKFANIARRHRISSYIKV